MHIIQDQENEQKLTSLHIYIKNIGSPTTHIHNHVAMSMESGVRASSKEWCEELGDETCGEENTGSLVKAGPSSSIRSKLKPPDVKSSSSSSSREPVRLWLHLT